MSHAAGSLRSGVSTLFGSGVALAARYVGRKRLRFTYLTGGLSERDYAELGSQPGWSQTSLQVAPGIRLRGLVRDLGGRLQLMPCDGAPLTLEECIRIGLEQQPALNAARASLAAAEDQRRALDNMRLAGLLSRELPVRKQQAALGVTIAVAALYVLRQTWRTWNPQPRSRSQALVPR